MTSEEYLKGAAVEKIDNSTRGEYYLSEEYADELVALLELDCYDGPTGDA